MMAGFGPWPLPPGPDFAPCSAFLAASRDKAEGLADEATMAPPLGALAIGREPVGKLVAAPMDEVSWLT